MPNLSRMFTCLLFFISTASYAQQKEEEVTQADIEKALDLSSATETLEQTVIGILHDFISHIPYIIAGLVVLMFTALFSFLIGKFVHKMAGRSDMRNSLRELLQRLTRITVWGFGFLLTAMVIFPGLTPAKALGGLGLASVAIGFAFKEIFENFFAGILLLWKYPFEKGDFIECEGIMGKVEDISVRMSQVRKTDGQLVVMPNSFLFKNPVYVLTNKTIRRITIMTGVAYDEDANAAIPVIEKAVKSCETVKTDQPVEVFLHAFGASSIDIEVAWWATPTPLGYRKSKSEVVGAIKAALDEAGIEIPFPYRTLTFKEPLPIQQQNNGSDLKENVSNEQTDAKESHRPDDSTKHKSKPATNGEAKGGQNTNE
ncbi:mechanosensitive ion channel family protein [Flocculibacter collagenilyticus]|uniref:mechanosensitive ion channel family protein n=1 Tax=Flocculibacter collagenilyticus TaxID=2744479 RepID=UPI001F44604C|nr:mechanosensitive ion channel family protein [Flocculibacter collagenilyticus]